MLIPDLSTALARVPGFAPGTRAQRLLPYAFVALCVLVLLLWGDKFWDANDDAHMAMLAGGYGISDTAAPGVVYSNVLWGWLAQHLGAFGVQGYTLITYAALLASCAAVGWVLYVKQVPGLLAAALLLGMAVHGLLEPQFSVTAGYATLAGVALLFTIEAARHWPAALAACLLLLTGASIRLQEALFVGLLSAPFLLMLLHRQRGTQAWRPLLATLVIAAALVGVAKFADTQYYAGAEWQRFKTMNALRRPFTDYGLAHYFASRPAALQAGGLDGNDLELLARWFFLDDKIYKPDALQRLLDSLPLGTRLAYDFSRYRQLAEPFADLQVDLLLAIALLALVLSRRRPLAMAGALLFLVAMLVFLGLGRPGVPRVFPAAAATLALLMLLDLDVAKQRLATWGGLLLLALVCIEGTQFFRAHQQQGQMAVAAQHEVCQLPTDQLQILWGTAGSLADRYIYDPAAPLGGRCALKLYLVGVLELVPDNLQQLHAATGGKDLVPALLDGQALHFLSTDERLTLLKRYFQEHYGATLDYRETASDHAFKQYLVQVTKAP